MMARMVIFMLLGSFGLLAAGASAQDPVVALDPTLMTGWAGGEAARESARGATRGRQESPPKRRLTPADRALAAKWCPQKDQFRRKLGSSNRNYRAFSALCAEAGYR